MMQTLQLLFCRGEKHVAGHNGFYTSNIVFSSQHSILKAIL